MVTYHLNISQVCFEGTLEKNEDVLFVSDLLALLFDSFLLNCQLLYAVSDLDSNSREISTDLLVVLKHLKILSDCLEKGLSKFAYFLCVYDAAFEQIFG